MSRQPSECVELAPAVGRPSQSESASKLDALHTLRESGRGQPTQRLQQPAPAGNKIGLIFAQAVTDWGRQPRRQPFCLPTASSRLAQRRTSLAPTQFPTPARLPSAATARRRPRPGPNPSKTRQNLPLDTLLLHRHHPALMSETENQLSLNRAASITGGVATNQIPVSRSIQDSRP